MKRALDIATTVLTSLLLLAFVILVLRGLIDPQQASARFGAPVSDAAGALFYRVYLSRNLVIVAAGAIFLLSVLALNGVTPPALHPVALALLALTAALLWRRARAVD
jgi:hypothetical protein